MIRDDRSAAVLVALAALVAYGAALLGTFVYDDIHSVRENTALTLANVPRFFGDPALFSRLDAPMYRPVLLTSFALNALPFGKCALAFKLVNVALHMAVAVLLFATLRRWPVPRLPALAAAGLFAVHPLASEAVNMVSGRSELLLVLAIVLAIRCQLAAIAGSRAALAGIAGCAVLACGSKESGVVLPVVLLVLEVARDPASLRAPWPAVRRVLPAVLVVAVYLLVRRAVFGVATADLSLPRVGDPLIGGCRDLTTQWATMATLLPRVLGQVLLPVGLSLDPPVVFQRTLLAPAPLVGLGLVAFLTFLGLRAPQRRPLVFLGTCLAWGTALPWVLLPLNTMLCEHRLYGPLLGLALVAAGALPARPSWVTLAAVPAIAAVLAFLAGARSLEYESEAKLWRKEIARGNPSYHAWFGLAIDVLARPDDPITRAANLHEARQMLERAYMLCPLHSAVRFELAETHLRLGPHEGDPFVALVVVEGLLAEAPDNAFRRLLHSRVLRACGERTGGTHWFERAVATALSALEVAPPKGLVYRTAADARVAQGDLDAAIALLDTAVARGLDHSSVLVHRGRFLLRAGRTAEAARDLRLAINKDPFDRDVMAFADEMAAASPR